MNGLTRWFSTNHVAANLLMLVICAAGLMSALSIKQEVFPEIEMDMITIRVPYLGATPAEVEEAVCVRVEEAIQGVDGILGFDPRSRGLYVQNEQDRRPRAIEVPAAQGLSGVAAVPRNYVRAILGEETQHVETEVAVDEVRVLDAAYRSAESGREVEIER